MTSEQLLVSGLMVLLFGIGFAGGWQIGRAREASLTEWVLLGGRKGWLNKNMSPELHAMFVEQMADEFDAQRHTHIPKYDWPTRDRYTREWSGNPE
jgi:hypothetical protein